MNQIYEDIDRFNRNIIESSWLGKMIFGSDRKYQTDTIDRFLEEIKSSLFKSRIPKSNIPHVVYETVEILSDHTGNTLLKHLNQSFGDREYNKKEALSAQEAEEKRIADIFLFVERCRKIGEKWPQMPAEIYDSSSDDEEEQQPSTSYSESDNIKRSRDGIFELLKEGVPFKQLASYKRFILLIQINCFIRSYGLYLHEKAAEINPQYILKDAQDIIVFSAPILWPKRIMMWLETDISPSAPPFPSRLARMSTITIYKKFFDKAFDELLSLKPFDASESGGDKDSLIAKTSIDEVLNTCRRLSMTIISSVHPWITYK